MLIQQLYEKYQIMPQLATHMLRVSAIGKLITDGWEDREMARKCVTACLLHDMGNLAKFDLDSRIMPIDNLPLWKERQKLFWEKYGHEAHAATYVILRELGLTEYIEYLEAESEIYAKDPTVEDFRRTPLPSLIVLYADLRVAVPGVVTLSERIADLTARYGGQERAEVRWGQLLEDYVQSLTKIDLAKITESDVIPLFDQLLEFSI